MERLHLSYGQALETPWREIERAMLVWSMDRERDNLDRERQKTS